MSPNENKRSSDNDGQKGSQQHSSGSLGISLEQEALGGSLRSNMTTRLGASSSRAGVLGNDEIFQTDSPKGSQQMNSSSSRVLPEKEPLAGRLHSNSLRTSTSRAGALGDDEVIQPPIPIRHLSRDCRDSNTYAEGEKGEKDQSKTEWMQKADPNPSGTIVTHGALAGSQGKDSAPDQSHDDQSTTDDSLAIAASATIPLRRSAPAVFVSRPADNSQLLQPSQRLVKVQPEDGERRPGAYSHNSMRRFTNQQASNDSEISPMDAADETMLEAGESGRVSEEDTVANTTEVMTRTTTGGVASASVAEDDTLVTASVAFVETSPERVPLDLLDPMDENGKCTRRCRLWITILVFYLLVAIGVGVGVPLSRSKQKDAGPSTAIVPTPSPVIPECSMQDVEDACFNAAVSSLITNVSDCVFERREKLLLRLPSNILEVNGDANSCSPENLALLSVALHAPNEESEAALRNRLGLSVLYYATNGTSWKGGRDWMSSDFHCNWTGVECFGEGNVWLLSLPHFKLTGPLPSILVTLLADLEELRLANNELTGTLPSEYSQLSTLAVNGNKFTGTLDISFLESSKLVQLDVGFNEELSLSSQPVSTFGEQLNLLHLSAMINDSGEIPSHIWSLKNLVSLELTSLNLNGTLPSSIDNLSNLRNLRLGENPQLHGTIPTELGNLVTLEHLHLDDCNMSGTVPSELGLLAAELRELYIVSNVLTGELPTELGLLTNLEELSFDFNEFTGTIPREVCALLDGKLAHFGGHLGSECGAEGFGGAVCPVDMPQCCNC